jgi:proteasome lid subunit RPN8/RPN11
MVFTPEDAFASPPLEVAKGLAIREDREALAPVDLAPALGGELGAHARVCFPEECCGLLFGDAQFRYLRAVRCPNHMTRLHRSDAKRYPQDGRYAFEMSPLDYLEASCEAQAQGVTAIYHSHVGSGLYLSVRDRQFASRKRSPFPEADQLVISVSQAGAVLEMGLFQRVSGTDEFVFRRVAPGLPSPREETALLRG